MKRIKFLVRKNLKMSPEKMAAQCVHAALALNEYEKLDREQTVIVHQISDAKFKAAGRGTYEGKQLPFRVCFTDAGYTEVAPDTKTVMAFLEDDPR